MNFNDKEPIYIQIISLLIKRIISGELKGGDKLPSVRELSQELKVNPNTIQRSYQELEREGVVYTQRGTGTFVNQDAGAVNGLKKTMAAELVRHFMVEMKALNFTKKEIIDIIMIEAKED